MIQQFIITVQATCSHQQIHRWLVQDLWHIEFFSSGVEHHPMLYLGEAQAYFLDFHPMTPPELDLCLTPHHRTKPTRDANDFSLLLLQDIVCVLERRGLVVGRVYGHLDWK